MQNNPELEEEQIAPQETAQHAEQYAAVEFSPEAEPADQTKHILERGLDRIESKASGVRDGIASVEKVVPEKANELKEMLNGLFDRSMSVVETMALMAAVQYLPNPDRPRSVEKSVVGGEVVYHHNDRETNMILNWLTGKEELPRPFRLKLLKKSVERNFKSYSVPLPKDFESMNEQQIKVFLRDAYRNSRDERFRGSMYFSKIDAQNKYPSEDWLRWFVPQAYKYDKALYDSLWALEQEVGNPKIEFGEPWDDRTGDFSPGRIRLRYPYVRGDYDESGTFVAEAAHAKQFKDNPWSSSFKFSKDMIKVAFDAVRNRESLSDAQSRLYSTPGTLEYEAHAVIEPELQKKVAPKDPRKN